MDSNTQAARGFLEVYERSQKQNREVHVHLKWIIFYRTEC